MTCQNTVLDKVDLLQALDFGSDLKQLSFTPANRCIFTSSDIRDDKQKPSDEVEDFKLIKAAFMG